MAQELEAVYSENAFVLAYRHAELFESVAELSYMVHVFFRRRASDEYIVQIDVTEV